MDYYNLEYENNRDNIWGDNKCGDYEEADYWDRGDKEGVYKEADHWEGDNLKGVNKRCDYREAYYKEDVDIRGIFRGEWREWEKIQGCSIYSLFL